MLESINDFLLEALDITSNQQYEKKSIFSTTISNIVGQRLDVSSYKEHFEMISNKYPNRKLSSLVEIDPAIKFSALNKDTTMSFIPMECIDEKYGEISEQREILISQIKGYTKFVEGDLLWAKYPMYAKWKICNCKTSKEWRGLWFNGVLCYQS